MKKHRTSGTSAIARGMAILLALLLTAVPVLAASYDLSTAGSSATINGAIFLQWFDPDGAGTGNFDTFLGIDANGTERGYNTGGTREFDTMGGVHTSSLLLSAVPTVDIGGTTYREFQLDVNESSNTPLLSLEELQLFTASSGNLTGYAEGPPPSIGGAGETTLVYDLDTDEEDNTVTLTYALNKGSGWADYLVMVPDSDFGSHPNCEYQEDGCTTYVYLYAKMGDGGELASDDGFEEWGVSEIGAVFTPATIAVDKFADQTLVFKGTTVNYTYLVASPSTLSDVTVTDDKCSPVEFVGGDSDDDDLLDPGEVWEFTCSAVINEDTTNTATAEGTPSEGDPVTDTDDETVEVIGPVRPILECVADHGDGTYAAYFGYKNDNDYAVDIPIGGHNKFTPAPQDRGQPTTFQPGRTPYYPNAAFSIDFDGSPLVWTLYGRTATASDNPAQRCAPVEPVKPILECVAEEKDGTLTAYFGYENLNDYVVSIPFGSDNKITPSSYDGVQPTLFGLPNVVPGRPGRTGFYPDGPFAFTVNFQSDEVIVWKLGPRTSTASNNPAQRCPEPTAVELASFAAEAGVGSVTLAWRTAAEIDNAGFNLYRATAPDGPYTKVNGALIAAEGDPVSGASYTFLDEGLSSGTYYYKLEDVDLSGVATLHGPVSVTVAPSLRRPSYRPTSPW
jgi:hypothetical protein